MTSSPLRVLFLCTGNSARSQMAEAILRRLSGGRVEVASAGSHPRPEIHPMAKEAVARVLKIGMDGQFPKGLEALSGERFDYVITVCDLAAESCPVFPAGTARIHWSIEDPAGVAGSDTEKRRAFEGAARELLGRIRSFLLQPSVASRIG